MPFDKTQPADSTKIRNLGVVIRPNWAAIEEADPSFEPYAINLKDRSILPGPIPVNPAAIADAYLLFAKKDGLGNKQLYVENSAGSVTSLTNNPFPVSAATGYSWLAGGLLIQWGYVTALAGGGSTNINFAALGLPDFTGAPFSIQTQVRHNGYDDNAVACVTAGATTGFTMKNSSSNARDFYWTAIGPRA